jgi:S-adenosylmethionine synthetase
MPVKRFIHTEELDGKPVSLQEVEIVERKGLGHPDTLIDGACESMSLALCDYYEQNFGRILHHNVDKGLLVGGESAPKFGGGKVIKPITILVAGRAVSEYTHRGVKQTIPVGEIADNAVRSFLKGTIRNINIDKDLLSPIQVQKTFYF